MELDLDGPGVLYKIILTYLLGIWVHWLEAFQTYIACNNLLPLMPEHVVSPVVMEWEKRDYIRNAGVRGELVMVPSPDKITRRDVLNNADILAPVISELGAFLCIFKSNSFSMSHRSIHNNSIWGQ